MRKDGGVRVINSGVDKETGKVKVSEGKAYFIGSDKVGRLKVSFFGPFYGSYNIAKLDPEYQMALIIGPSKDYAWILARSPNPSRKQCEPYYQAAEKLGIPQNRWIIVRPCQR